MYMSTRELLETFGTGKKGQRRLSSDMVRWLLSDPPRAMVDAAAVLKYPINIPDPPVLDVIPEFKFQL
jgi:hypothetical protein